MSFIVSGYVKRYDLIDMCFEVEELTTGKILAFHLEEEDMKVVMTALYFNELFYIRVDFEDGVERYSFSVGEARVRCEECGGDGLAWGEGK